MNFVVRDAYAAANIMRTLFSKTSRMNTELKSKHDVPLPERFEFLTTGPSSSSASSGTEEAEEKKLEELLGEGSLTILIQGGSHTERESTVPTIFQVFYLFYIVFYEMKFSPNGTAHPQQS